MNRLTALLTGIWLGMQIMAGYVAGPILFEQLERQTAGNIAGTLFAVNNWLGLAAWLFAWFAANGRSSGYDRQTRSIAPKFIVVLLVLTAANQFLLAPAVTAHKNGTENWLLSLIGGSFGMWHGVSNMVYLACTLIGFGLLLRYLRFDK